MEKISKNKIRESVMENYKNVALSNEALENSRVRKLLQLQNQIIIITFQVIWVIRLKNVKLYLKAQI